MNREDLTRALPKKTVPKNNFKTDRNSGECSMSSLFSLYELTREPFRAASDGGLREISTCLSFFETVELQCEPEDFVVRVNFTQPFRGIVHAGPKSNKCLLRGDGGQYYTLRIPLDGCGTIHNVSFR